jgi:signal peptidase II
VRALRLQPVRRRRSQGRRLKTPVHARHSWPWFALAAVVALADQATKQWILARISPGEVIEVTGFFNVVLAYNRGAAFSFLSDAGGWQRYAFIAIAVGAIALIAWLLLRHPRQTAFCLGLALILGGAIGNVWDRALLGHVVDFLDFHAGGRHWPAFNLADSAITVGAVLLILDGFRNQPAKSRSPTR